MATVWFLTAPAVTLWEAFRALLTTDEEEEEDFC
jgi:hypothetical protein